MRNWAAGPTLLAISLLTGRPADAQSGPEDVASLLASIRALKTECRIKPVPSRLHTLVEGAGYRLADFTPGRRYYPLVQANLEQLRPSSRSERDGFCDRLAERVRRSPLNAPRASFAARPSRRSSGAVDLNRASLDELNSLGAGMIGRTIIYGRPYASPEDLVDRGLLNLRDFARIRDRVTVR